MSLRRGWLRATWIGLAVAFALVVSWRSFAAADGSRDLAGDAGDYRRITTHLLLHGVLSNDPAGTVAPRPSAFREPLYPLWLAAVASVIEPRAVGNPQRVEAALRGGLAERGIVWAQWLLLLGSAAIGGRCVWRRSGSTAAGTLAGVAIATSPALLLASSSLATEALAAPLALAAGVALERALRCLTPRRAALAGLAAGALAIARSSYLIFVPLAGLLLLIAGWRRRALVPAALFVTLGCAPTAAWALRNLVELGRPTIGGARAAVVLLARAELDRRLTGDEIPAALISWVPTADFYTLAYERYPRAVILHRNERNKDDFFARALHSWTEALAATGSEEGAGERVGAKARAMLRESPGRHLLACALVGWRGLFAERGLPGWPSLRLGVPVSLWLQLLGVAWLLRSIRRRDLAAASLALLPVGGFLLHAAWTEFLPRFSIPTLGLLWVIAASWLATQLPDRREAGELRYDARLAPAGCGRGPEPCARRSRSRSSTPAPTT